LHNFVIRILNNNNKHNIQDTAIFQQRSSTIFVGENIFWKVIELTSLLGIRRLTSVYIYFPLDFAQLQNVWLSCCVKKCRVLELFQ